jgi:ketosteroid isomerase-like protein
MESLAQRVRYAMEAIDLATMEELLAPDARWGAPEQDVPTCRDAKEILSWYELAQANGVSADVTEVVVVGENIVVGLKIHTNPKTKTKTKTNVNTRWQVLSVRDGRIAEIRGYETRGDATSFATSGVSNWQ